MIGKILPYFFSRRRESYGLNNLDHRLASFVKGYCGVFIEAGANDGLSQSNTRYFEKYRGWRGILIEPIPTLAQKCRLNRPRAIVEELALVGASANPAVVSMTYCNLMSLVSGARGNSELDAAHVESAKAHLKAGEEIYQIDVKTDTLENVILRNKVRDVDLLSLDVEGFEIDALEGLNLKNNRPHWIIIEANDLPAVDKKLAPYYSKIAQLSHHDILYRLK